MNIKEHIEAGHYPKDEKGRALVPTREAVPRTVRVYATDNGELPIVGVFVQAWDVNEPQGFVCRWDSDGLNPDVEGHVRLGPPSPRKVKVTAYAIVQASNGHILRLREDPPGGIATGIEQCVQLTGEYEEPWSQP